jgi:hypothetical protein
MERAMVENLWHFLGEFDDRDGFRVLVLLMFLFGTPLVIGIWAKVVVWSTRQVRTCQHVLETEGAAGTPAS